MTGLVGRGPRNAPDVRAWREDLAVCRDQLPKRHGNLFHSLTREEFHAALDSLDDELPKLTLHQVTTAILRLVARVNDGHTRVRRETMGHHMLPVRLHYFSDGLFVEAGEESFADLVGGRVVRIGTMPVDTAYAAVRPLVPVDGDNEHRRRLLAPELLATPEVLQSIGASASDEVVDLTVERGGVHELARLPAGPFRPWQNHGWPANPDGWVDARASAKSVPPLWLQHGDTHYWHSLLPEDETLYIQYSEVHDAAVGDPVATYFDRVIREAERRNAPRVVLDLRLNGGGDNQLNRAVWHALLTSERLNQKGKLWTLIGPKTFSAAMCLVDELELNTHALFAGEPTGAAPNHWGDPVDVTLPHSRIVIQTSTLWWQFVDPRDDRDCRTPDLSIPLSSSDYARNIDPVLEAVRQQ
jgi:hypothetical protein